MSDNIPIPQVTEGQIASKKTSPAKKFLIVLLVGAVLLAVLLPLCALIGMLVGLIYGMTSSPPYQPPISLPDDQSASVQSDPGLLTANVYSGEQAYLSNDHREEATSIVWTGYEGETESVSQHDWEAEWDEFVSDS